MLHGDEWDQVLADYVEGTLPPGKRRRVDEHLAFCPECVAAVAAALTGREALLRADHEPAVAGDASSFLAGVERRVARAEAAKGTSPPPVRALRRGFPGRRAGALCGADQVRPAAWFLLSLPALGAALNPRGPLLLTALAGLALGTVLEYATLREAASDD